MFTLCHSVAATPKCLNDNLFFRKHFGVSRRDISERAGVIGPRSSPRRAGAAGGHAAMFAQVCVSNAEAENNERREIVEIDFVYQVRGHASRCRR